MKKPKVIVILGQTATGKSDLAVKIARKLNGEIISADSRQVYKGLDVGTGKITPQEMRDVPHHLLDVADPKKQFSVAQFQMWTNRAIAQIVHRGGTAIICGGTGFYIDAVTRSLTFPEVPPDNALRRRLALVSDRALMLKLKKLDPDRAKNIDPHNKVRLIRAIEIAHSLGHVPHLPRRQVGANYKFVKIGLYLPKEKLKEKISIRLFARIRAGMIAEARKLHKNGLSYKRMRELGLEYRYLALYLQGKITKTELLKNLNIKIYQYAKRQMAWFKRDKEIHWFDASEKGLLRKVFMVCGR